MKEKLKSTLSLCYQLVSNLTLTNSQQPQLEALNTLLKVNFHYICSLQVTRSITLNK